MEVFRELWNTIRSGRVWRGEVINRRKDGTVYREEMRITPLRQGAGEITGYIAIKQDVSEWRAEDEAKNFLAAIVDSSGDAIIGQTLDGNVLTWNRAAERIFGYSAPEVLGKHVSILVAPERLDGLAYLTEQVAQGHSVSQYQGLCLRKDGRRFHVSVTVCPIRNAAGQIAAKSSIIHDSSDRWEAEQAQSFLAAIVESSGDAIHAVGLDGTILSWNLGAEVLLGYRSLEIIGKNAAMLTVAGQSDRVRECLAIIQQGRAIEPLEGVLRHKDGRDIEVSLSISPIRDLAGQVAGASVIAHDIGNRIRAEKKLQESEERFGEIFEHAPFGMCVAGLDGALLQVNAAFCRMLGYSEPGVDGNAVERFDASRRPEAISTAIGTTIRPPGGICRDGATVRAPRGNCDMGAHPDLVGAKCRRKPLLFCGSRGRHHRAKADRGSAAGK